MQNKPNYRKTKLYASIVLIMTYKNSRLYEHPKNKPKQTQFLQSQKMNTTLITTKSYENTPPRTPKKRTQFLRNQNLKKSGRQDLNLRPLAPHASALAKLRHAPIVRHFNTESREIQLIYMFQISCRRRKERRCFRWRYRPVCCVRCRK
jgi:hypothetical protein